MIAGHPDHVAQPVAVEAGEVGDYDLVVLADLELVDVERVGAVRRGVGRRRAGRFFIL